MRLLIGGARYKLFHLKNFCDALEKLGVTCKLVHDAEVINEFANTKIAKILGWPPSDKKFNDLVDDFKPDVIFVDYQGHFGLSTIRKKIPLLVHLRGDLWSENKWAKETLYKTQYEGRGAAFLAKHKTAEKYFKQLLRIIYHIVLSRSLRIAEKCFTGALVILPICKYLGGVVSEHHPNKSVEVLYQGIDPSLWYPVKAMELEHPCVGLLQSANIWGKTKEMLTLQKVLEAMPNVTFYWVGDGPYRETILEPLKKYKNFKWLGELKYPDKVREYLAGIDVYALVSGIDMSPLTLLEAALMEKPVVATIVGGIPELMDNNKTGFLVEKGDHDGWIEKLSILINDTTKARQMGVAGRKFVTDNFSWDKIARNFITILEKYHIKL